TRTNRRAFLGWTAAALLTTAVAFVSVSMASGLGSVQVSSVPSGAQLKVGAQVVGTTPATLRLPANGSKVRITVSKAGFKDKSVLVTPKSDKLTRVKVKLSK
ncbi:MAG: PEGA domain-containing protein, partial [Myxococcota bacterium]